ncbi:hypothetical protein FQZ97_1023140 [compost metagenome]
MAVSQYWRPSVSAKPSCTRVSRKRRAALWVRPDMAAARGTDKRGWSSLNSCISARPFCSPAIRSRWWMTGVFIPYSPILNSCCVVDP